MNRNIFGNAERVIAERLNPLHLPGKELREETEAALRDMALVLALTRRVKTELLAEAERRPSVSGSSI